MSQTKVRRSEEKSILHNFSGSDQSSNQTCPWLAKEPIVYASGTGASCTEIVTIFPPAVLKATWEIETRHNWLHNWLHNHAKLSFHLM